MSSPKGHHIEACGCTDVGRVRMENEDSLLMADLTTGRFIEGEGILNFTSGIHGSLFSVADGMGGAAAGGTASRLGLRVLHRELLRGSRRLKSPGDDPLQSLLLDAMGAANDTVYRLGMRNQEYAGMGTTLTVTLELFGRIAIGQVGDSRAYLLNEDGIHQLTRDQSLAAEMVRNGRLSQEEARCRPERNILLQALGVRATVEVSLRCIPVHPGDILMLCSDGLHSLVSDDEIYDCVAGAPDPSTACRALVDLSNNQRGSDNISVILAQFHA